MSGAAFSSLAIGIIAGTSALWINRVRLRHERRLARFDALQRLFADAGALLTSAMIDPENLVTPPHLAKAMARANLGAGVPSLGGVALTTFRARLLLWLEPEDAVVKAWDEAALAGVLYVAHLDDNPRLPDPVDYQAPFHDASEAWLTAARQHREATTPR